MMPPKRDRQQQAGQTKIKVRGSSPIKTAPTSPTKHSQLLKPQATVANLLPRNVNGMRTHLTCELCGYEPTAKNKYQARQDHLMRAHFMDKVLAAFPDLKSKHCPFPACPYVAKDKQYLLRHYVIQHRKNEQWLTEALAERGIKYTPVHVRARPGEPKKKPMPKLAFVINQPTLVQSYTCEKCHKKFDERYHLVNHNRYMHLKYDDDDKKMLDQHRCDICGKIFVDIAYVQKHKNSVHLKIREFPCDICDKMFSTKHSVRSHKKNVHFGPKAQGNATSTDPTPSTSTTEVTTIVAEPAPEPVISSPVVAAPTVRLIQLVPHGSSSGQAIVKLVRSVVPVQATVVTSVGQNMPTLA